MAQFPKGMKFTISKQAYLDAISQVQHVVSARTTLAILSNVLLKARDGQLELTTTDLDVGVSGTVQADVGGARCHHASCASLGYDHS
jgi:DNA polymerase-3 subunit beta